MTPSEVKSKLQENKAYNTILKMTAQSVSDVGTVSNTITTTLATNGGATSYYSNTKEIINIINSSLSTNPTYDCIATDSISVYSSRTNGIVQSPIIATIKKGTFFNITNITRKMKVSGNSTVVDENKQYSAAIKFKPDSERNIVKNEITGYIELISSGELNNFYIVYSKDSTKWNLNKVPWAKLENISDIGFDITPLNYANGKLNEKAVENTEDLKKASDKKESIKNEKVVPNPVVENYYPEAKSSRWVMDDKGNIVSGPMTDYDTALDSMDISKLRGIFGLPYQFLPTTDCRVDNSDSESVFGITYTEMIASRFPLLYITPGEPVFLSDAHDGEDRKKYITDYVAGVLDNDNENLNNLLDGYAGKLYSIEPKYSTYFKYVNPMCRMGAFYLGLDPNSNDSEDEKSYKQIDGVDLTNYNWAWNDNEKTYATDIYSGREDGASNSKDFAPITSALTDLAKSSFYKAAIPFYINSDNSFLDTITNETTESSLASNINGLADKARELQFLIGSTTAAVLQNFSAAEGALTETKTNIEQLLSNLSEGNIFNNLFKNVKTIVSGGRLIFPQIWSNSSFSKAYQINIKLTTPDLDKKSWYLNIYVPLCHLIALILPRGEFQNGYTAPFIIKAFYKGMFNIDMGIITDMNITKGKEGGWTKDGLPTVVDVTFTIQDLYSILSMSPTGPLMKSNVLQNIAEMDYLANLCGINIHEPDVGRMIEMYICFNIDTVFTDIPSNITTGLGNKLSNKINKIFSMF